MAFATTGTSGTDPVVVIVPGDEDGEGWLFLDPETARKLGIQLIEQAHLIDLGNVDNTEWT